MADERRKFEVALVTPDGSVFEGEAEMIIVPGDAGEIGVRTPAGGLSVLIFNLGMALTRGVDTLVRVFVPGFSLARFFTRLIGQQYVWAFLLSQTRPLVLPTELLGEVHTTLNTWSVDPKAPRWLNAIERGVHGPRLPSPSGTTQP